MPFAKHWALRSNAFVRPKCLHSAWCCRVRFEEKSPFRMSPKRWPKGHLGNYQFTAYRSSNGSKPVDVERLTILRRQTSLLAQVTEGIRRGVATAEATVLVRDLCKPSGQCHDAHADRPGSKGRGERTGRQAEGARTERYGTARHGALLGGSGAVMNRRSSSFWNTKARRRRRVIPPVVLVGKTITFDTGGISQTG